MNDFVNNIKPSVRAISAYHLNGKQYEVKLNQNENPYDLPKWLKDELLDEFCGFAWNRYPSFGNLRLIEKLSSHVQIEPNRILVGNGSNELLQTLMAVSLSAGKKLLLVAPTFLIYHQLGRVAEADICEIEFEEDWSFPVNKILSTLGQEQIELCIFCSPNSPTGATLKESDLIQILKRVKGLVLVDEAYHEFSKTSCLELQSDFKNLIITRTFSKAMGLAGLRIGYLIAHPALITEINKAKLPYNLNIFSEFVALKLLDHYDLVNKNVEKILSEKERLTRELFELNNVTPFPSEANFFMIKTPTRAPELFDKLADKGVLVRDISKYHPRLKNHLRISIGTPEENENLINSLKTTLF